MPSTPHREPNSKVPAGRPRHEVHVRARSDLVYDKSPISENTLGPRRPESRGRGVERRGAETPGIRVPLMALPRIRWHGDVATLRRLRLIDYQEAGTGIWGGPVCITFSGKGEGGGGGCPCYPITLLKRHTTQGTTAEAAWSGSLLFAVVVFL